MKPDDTYQQDFVRSSLELRLRRLGRRGDGHASDWIDQQSKRHVQHASASPCQSEARNDLTKAGFSDITIMPSSFLVRAKDSDGNPVMMVINPDFMTE